MNILQTLHRLELEDNGIDMKDDALLLVQCLGTISDQADTARETCAHD
jgi:hypothetical protein